MAAKKQNRFKMKKYFKLKAKKYLSLLSLLLLMLPFSNCQQFEGAHEEGDLSFLSEDPVPSGIILYTNNCASCHNPIASSNKMYSTAADITEAIANNGTMKTISSLAALSETEIDLIALALNPDREEVADVPSDVSPVVGNRDMVQSNLIEVFATSYVFNDLGAVTGSSVSANTVAIIDRNISTRPEAFGGYCSRYDSGGECQKADLEAQPLPVRSAISQGYLIKTCEEILQTNQPLIAALVNSRVMATAASDYPAINATSVEKFIHYYSRGRPVSDAAIKSSLDVAADAQSRGLPRADQWRFLILPICVLSGDLL